MATPPEDNGNIVPQWTEATVPKKQSYAVYLDAWRGGLRGWRGERGWPGERRGLLQSSPNRLIYLLVINSSLCSVKRSLNMEEAIAAMREEAGRYGLTFELAPTKRALRQVARETKKRLTAATLALSKRLLRKIKERKE